MKIIILAGGGGTRLWPLSRASQPKQFTKLVNSKTLIENTLDRFRGDYSQDDIYISISPQCEPLIKQVLPNFSKSNIIIEPEKKDTGPAMGFVAAKLSLNFPDEPIAFIPSDAYIQNPKKLVTCLKVAEKLIKKTGKMLDIAIPPEFPSMHLGYTKVGEKYDTMNGVEIYNFAGHTEKPDLKTAQAYLKNGNYLWHGNFYMWTPKLFLEAYKKYAPNIYNHLIAIQKALKTNNSALVKQEFSKMEKVSIDYCVTEKMNPKEVLIIKGDFGWSDIGAFDILYDKLKEQSDGTPPDLSPEVSTKGEASEKGGNKDGNIVKANHTGINTKNCLIYDTSWCGKSSRATTNSSGGNTHYHQRPPLPANKKIATIGVENLVIIDTPDALLVCPKNKSQDIKKIVEKLKKEGEEKFL